MKTKTDLYTKIMLTAIVALLATHLVKDLNWVEKATASPAPTAQQGEVIDVNIVKVNGNTVWSSGIPVEVKNSKSNKIPVEVK